MRVPKLPPGLRTLRALQALNALTVACALATSTGTLLVELFRRDLPDSPLFVSAAVSTFTLSFVWTRLLQARRRVERWKRRIGWVLSPLLAGMTASLAAGLSFAFDGSFSLSERLQRFFIGSFMGGSVTALLMVPALVLTLLCFGIPLVWAQRLADRGRAGEEQGERVVAMVAMALGLLSLWRVKPQHLAGSSVPVLLGGLSLTAIVTGVSAALLATSRAKRRRAFVADAEAGRVRGYRVETERGNTVLVRVGTEGEVEGGGERFEAVDELERDGEAERARVR